MLEVEGEAAEVNLGIGGGAWRLLSPVHVSSPRDDRGSLPMKPATSERSTGDIGVFSRVDNVARVGVASVHGAPSGVAAYGDTGPSTVGSTGVGAVDDTGSDAVGDTGIRVVDKLVGARRGREAGHREDLFAGEHRSDNGGGPSVDRVERTKEEVPRIGVLVTTAVTIVIAAGLTLTAPSTVVHEGDDTPARSSCGGVNATAGQLRIVNFNVYMGYDRRGEDNAFRVGKLLRDLEADVAVLQETELMHLTLGTRYYGGQVARAAGMVLASSPPVAEDTWGCLVFSRLPVVRSGRRRLPRGTGENACEAHATVALGEGRGLATVINVHLGNQGTADNDAQVAGVLDLVNDLRAGTMSPSNTWPGEGRTGRARRSERESLGRTQGIGGGIIGAQYDNSGEFIILAGDFNFNSSSDGYNRLVGQGGLVDSCPADAHDREVARGERREDATLPRDGNGEPDPDDPLDFVFFEPRLGVNCTNYEVHREFSQERYADGYPSVTVFELECV